MLYERSDFVSEFSHSRETLSFNVYMIMRWRELLACFKHWNMGQKEIYKNFDTIKSVLKECVTENQPISWATELCFKQYDSKCQIVYGLKSVCVEQRCWQVGIGELCVILRRTSSSASTSKAKWFDDTYYVFVPRSGEVQHHCL